MVPTVRNDLSTTALALGSAIAADDAAKVQSLAAPDIAGSFNATAYLVRTTSDSISGDVLAVTQLYELDANGRAASDPAPADFSCALTGSASETDFSIAGLPPGLYGFAMVEASGQHPWLLALLLRQQGGVWKMAGFYPHATSAAGHDGLWFWHAAREELKATHPWLAWLYYGEADTLLRPANFVTSTHLDKLRAEQKAAAPAELRDGVSTDTPLNLGGFSLTTLSAAGSEDGKSLDLLLHYSVSAVGDPTAAKARNLAAARAVLTAHPELRPAFARVIVFADAPGQPAFATELPMNTLQ
jgi:hypothetical protein